MTFNVIKQFFYALYLTNNFGYKLSKTKDAIKKKRIRIAYSNAQLDALNITVKVKHKEKLPIEGQYLVIVNHRSIIDPPIIEIALKNTNIFGHWISKKELYNSFFFGLFVRNAGSILLDRKQNQMANFFTEIKTSVKNKNSVFIFPEGTRNKTKDTLTPFKEGARLIALKNRLPILPLYIETDAGKALKNALEDRTLKQEVTIVVGEMIDYKDKTKLDIKYKERFLL